MTSQWLLAPGILNILSCVYRNRAAELKVIITVWLHWKNHYPVCGQICHTSCCDTVYTYRLCKCFHHTSACSYISHLQCAWRFNMRNVTRNNKQMRSSKRLFMFKLYDNSFLHRLNVSGKKNKLKWKFNKLPNMFSAYKWWSDTVWPVSYNIQFPRCCN